MNFKALRIKIYQPTTHFRIPFSYQRRHTYPLPPYSTVLGLFINLLGITNQKDELFKKLMESKLSVSGNFEIKHTEYIWFRNLNKEYHESYFGSQSIRTKNGSVEHIGGQSPMRIDVLENMRITIHISNEKSDFLNKLKQTIENPFDRTDIIHLGRAEDWLVFEDVDFVELQKKDNHKNYERFFWIPEKIWLLENINSEFKDFEGLFFNLPVYSTIENYDKTFNHNAKRQFYYLRTKLNDGAIKGPEYLYDGELPVFFADLNKAN